MVSSDKVKKYNYWTDIKKLVLTRRRVCSLMGRYNPCVAYRVAVEGTVNRQVVYFRHKKRGKTSH